MTAPATDIAPLIAAERLALSRGGRALAEDLSLTVKPGGALVLHGPNGAGKTTLLRALAGLVRPDAGRIALSETARIAFVGHADGLKPSETVHGALRFWAALDGAASGATETAMRAYRIIHLSERACGRLSAGQRRRVALARAAQSGRALWLLDEPAAPLDARGRALLADAVAAHRAQGGAVIAATHLDLDWPDAEIVEIGAFESAPA